MCSHGRVNGAERQLDLDASMESRDLHPCKLLYFMRIMVRSWLS